MGNKMAFDYKKEYKELYQPKAEPALIEVPSMNFLAVRGQGDPNLADGEYQQAISLLYGMAFTIKMSKKGGRQIEGYFDYVVPPLEGLWWQPGAETIDYQNKQLFCWISMIRLPDFVARDDFAWAAEEATRKKRQDFSSVEFLTYNEGLCVQCMHAGPYDDEPSTLALMADFTARQGYEFDLSERRYHHEIYLSDPRRSAPEKLKTVIRYPVRRA